MKKKHVLILSIVCTILLLGLGYWGLTVYREIKSPAKETYDAISQNDIVIRINDAVEFFNEMDQPQLGLLNLLRLDLNGQHRQWLHQLRSTPILSDIKDALLLMQLEDKDSISVCLVIAVEHSYRKAVKRFLEAELKHLGEHRYVSPTHPNYYVAFCDGLLLISPSQEPMEIAYQQIRSGQSVMKEPAFEKLWNAAGRNVSANIWFHAPSLVPKLLKYYEIQAPFQHLILNITRSAQWLEYDIFRRLDFLVLSGYASQEKDHPYGLHAIDYLQASASDIPNYLPASSQFFLALSTSDFKHFYETLRTQYPIDSEHSHLESLRPGLSELAEDFFQQCHPREMALFVFEDPNQVKQTAGVLLLDDIAEACQGLGLLSQYASGQGLEWIDSQIHNIQMPSLFSEALWSVFPTHPTCFVLRKGSALFFSDQEATLRYIENCVSQKITLDRNRNYSELKPYLQEKTNVRVFISNIRHLFKEGPAHSLNFQFSGNEGNTYALALLGQVIENDSIESSPLPEPRHLERITNLFKGRILKGPWAVANHRVRDTFYLLQDDKNILCYLDSKGEVLWRRPLDGIMLSKAWEVDYLGNEKIQYLLNTRKSLYLLDIYGRHVNDFPVSFKVPAASGLEVIYAKIPNRYQIRFVDENGRTHVLSKEARKIK